MRILKEIFVCDRVDEVIGWHRFILCPLELAEVQPTRDLKLRFKDTFRIRFYIQPQIKNFRV